MTPDDAVDMNEAAQGIRAIDMDHNEAEDAVMNEAEEGIRAIEMDHNEAKEGIRTVDQDHILHNTIIHEEGEGQWTTISANSTTRSGRQITKPTRLIEGIHSQEYTHLGTVTMVNKVTPQRGISIQSTEATRR